MPDNYDPAVNLRMHPGLNMHLYGLNPYQEHIYRVVFAPSRRTLVCGDHGSGYTEARWMPEYGHIGDLWVMEKWLSGIEIEPRGKAAWDRERSINGPYPERGDYFWCHTFETCTPDEANLAKLVSWINEGKNRPYGEVRAACENKYNQETKSTESMQDSLIRDALPAFGMAPLVGYGGGRGTKTATIIRSANELGLPLKTGRTHNPEETVLMQLDNPSELLGNQKEQDFANTHS